MASKHEIIRQEDKFSLYTPDGEKLYAANQILSKWFVKAADLNLNAMVFDEDPDDQIPDPGPVPAANLNADQLRVYETTKKQFVTQQRDLAELASYMRNTITEEVYGYLRTASAVTSITSLSPREMYEFFQEVFVKVGEETLTKVIAKLRTPFIKGQCLSTHIVEHVKCRDQITLARGPIATKAQIDDLVETLQSINTADTHRRTINEVREKSNAKVVALDAPERAFQFFVQAMMKADRDKSFGSASSEPSEPSLNTGVPHVKVDVSAIKLDMVKEDPMERVLKILETVLVSKAGGGAAPRGRSKPVFNKRAVDAAREKHKDCDINDGCPVHPGHGTHGPGHTWGACSYYTGKEFIPKGKKN
jgi:hypothetical protein